MLVKEYRVILPCSVEEYQVGQLYSVAEASKNETGGGEGVQVLENKPYEKDGEKGQFTHKIYHLGSRLPSLLAQFAPKKSLEIHEEAWNAYPYCRTEADGVVFVQRLTAWYVSAFGGDLSPYMTDKFLIKIETWHKPDMGKIDNVHKLDPSDWEKVEVVNIDIGDPNQVEKKDYKEEEDPTLFKSEKTGRGPLGPNWKEELETKTDCPHMCAYKLVTVKCKVPLIQGRVESFIHKQEKRIFTNFHRQLFCWLDRWVALSMEDIRRMEDETQRELEEIRQKGSLRGTKAAED